MKRLRSPAATIEIRRVLPFFVLVVAGSTGCAATTSSAPATSGPKQAVELGETRIETLSEAELEKRFHEASDRLLKDDFVASAEQFDKIVAADPTGRTAVPSLFNAGIAYHGMGKLETALQRFESSVQQGPEAPTTKDAFLRIARIYGQMERWDDLEKVSANILARTDLTALERIGALGSRGLGLVELGRVDEARTAVLQARDEIEDRKLGMSGVPPLELAQVSFALGEIRRLKGEEIKFVPFPVDFGAVLEDRCTQLLDAQSAYQDAMRSLDAHWSAMAGFRVGQLYHQLHKDVMQVPVPANAKTVRQKQLWEGAMRMRYRILLEKGLKMMTATVDLGARTGESSAWVSRAKEAKKELEVALAREKEALAKLPVTEQELKDALEELRNQNPPKKP
ncbi:MAG: hypothetical protein HOW73_04005 [Polyangiaceae bacterium]|nr:hypothetical protein [Polyangiaceae bacterium]